jgi:Na+/H+ antiporter NhaD/arsenite permease-like protein
MNFDFLAGVVIGILAGAALIIGSIATVMWMSERIEKRERFK